MEQQDVPCDTEKGSHMLQCLFTCLLLFLKQVLAQFETHINFMPGNNRPKSEELSLPSQRLTNAEGQSLFTAIGEDRESLLLSE